MVCSDLTEANGENSKLSSSENALCIVVLEKKGRPLLRNAMGLAFIDILNYLDQKKSNPHKQFREKKLLGFFFDFFFFLAEYPVHHNYLSREKNFIPAVLSKAIDNLLL